MQYIPKIASPGTLSQSTVSQGACTSCRAKKLKCDRLPHSCNNCTRLKELCIVVDVGSGEPYARNYLDSLHEKAEGLRRTLRETQHSEQTGLTEPLPIPTAGGTVSMTSPDYSGTGSIFSLGQLVAAAVSSGSDNSVLRLGAAVAQERKTIERAHSRKAELPALGDAVELLELYFQALHVTVPFMRRDDVFAQLERLYTCNPAYTGEDKTQDLFQVHMVLAIGAMRPAGRWEEDCAWDHYMTAMKMEPLLTEQPAFAQVQNLLLVFVFATLHDVGTASTWEIIRQVMRICVKYGFHSRETAESDLVREQLRRRIFWSAYISDRHCSQNLGRPVALSEEEITIELPINQDDARIRKGDINAAAGQYTEVTNLIRHTLLRRLGTNARIALNRLSREKAALTEQVESARNWTDALQAWYNSSIVKQNPSNAYETKEYLDINFHRERMKFLSYLVVPSEAWEPWDAPATARIEDLWQYILSARQILLAYKKQANDGFLAPNWTYVQDVLKSGFGILYCALRIPEQRRRNREGSGLLDSELETVVAALRLCGEILTRIVGQWQTVKRHTTAFIQMSEAVLEHITRVRLGAVLDTPMDEAEMDGFTAEPGIGRGTTDFDFSTIDWTLDVFHSEGVVPLTDAELAELFDLAPEAS